MPPTPLLDQLIAEVDAYMSWWVKGAWWHMALFWGVIIVVWLAFVGGLGAFLEGPPKREPERPIAWSPTAKKL